MCKRNKKIENQMGTGSVQHVTDVEWCEWSASGLFLSLLRVIGAFCNVHFVSSMPIGL